MSIEGKYINCRTNCEDMPSRRSYLRLVSLGTVSALAGCNFGGGGTGTTPQTDGYSVTPTVAPTATLTPTPMDTPTETPTSTDTPTATATPTVTSTRTPTPTPSFSRDTPSGAFWTTKIAEDDNFGASMAVDGDRVLVGSPGDDTSNGKRAGSAYVFERGDGLWTQQAQLIADDGDTSHQFGVSVALDGERALIGADGASVPEEEYAGWAYVFERVDGTWTERALLAAGDGRSGFGTSVALDGGTALVGAPRDTGPNGHNAGSVYIFERGDRDWTQATRLTADDRSDERRFGTSVALDGDRAVVGSDESNCDGESCSGGVAHVFQRSDGAWDQQTVLDPKNNADYGVYGMLLALDGDRMIVGAREDREPGENFAGAVSLFGRAESEWARQTTLSPSEYVRSPDPDKFPKAHLSNTVALDGETALVSITVDLGPWNAEPTATFIAVFERTTGEWTQQARLVPGADSIWDNYGHWPFSTSLGFREDSVLVGDSLQQKVYVYSRNW